MKRVWLILVVLLMTYFQAGCGGGSNGIGTTSSVTADVTNNTSASVVASITSDGTSNVLNANAISITLTSVALTSGTVRVSPVTIQSIEMNLTPLPYSSIPANTTHALSPVIPNPQFAAMTNGIGNQIPVPGTLRLDGNELIGISDGDVILTAFINSGLTNAQYKYIANITYHCKEDLTGATFSVPISIGLEVDI